MSSTDDRIEHADASGWLPAQGTAAAKAVIFDPPYAVGTPVRGREDGAAGSVFAPFQNLHRWLMLTRDVLAPGGVVIVFADWRRMSDIGYLCSISGLRPATTVAWVRKRPGTGGLMRAAWDPVLIAARGVPDAVDRAAVRNVVETFEEGGEGVIEADYPVPRLHPYGKPPKVTTHILSRICREGDLVLDPFAGGGSSRLSARDLDLRWAGADIDADYAEACYQDGCPCGKQASSVVALHPTALLTPARAQMRLIIAEMAAANIPVVAPAVRARLHAAGFQVQRETVSRWLSEDQPRQEARR
jgi:site-specific DNA-methyltransferase (adenine-specific)